MRGSEFTRILDWPGYRVFRHEIDETTKTLRLWVRRKRGNRKLICSGCGRKFSDAHDDYQREVRDLPWRKYQTTVIIELYRVCCPQCGVRVEKVPQIPGKAPFSKLLVFVGQATCSGTGSVCRRGLSSRWLSPENPPEF
jgi:transposase